MAAQRSLDGTPVVVAGASGPLGRAVARALLDAGRPVVAVCRSEPGPLIEELGGAGDLRCVRADVADPAGAERAIAGVAELGAVVNAVGGFASGPLVHETDPAELERQLRLHLGSSFLLARAALPRLLAAGGGAFVAVGARAAVSPFAGGAAYAIAKAAVVTLVEALDVEYRARGVRANAILPGVIDTPANRAASPDADRSRWVSPDAVARVVRFLVSDDSEPTSGAAIPVYGRA